jgi:ABC-type transport system involved in multi-copper enzyme maturation permease subunit
MWPGWVGAADVAVFLGVCLGATVVLSVYSVLRLRAESAGRSRRGWWGVFGFLAGLSRRLPGPRWSGPSLDGNPVLWREWHRNRPSRTIRVVWTLYALAVLAGSAFGLYEIVSGATLRAGNTLALFNGFAVWFGLLILSVTAPTALGEERTRGSLDVLMSTPLSTRSIVLAKWWGAFRSVPWIAALPALGALFLALAAPEFPTGLLRGTRPGSDRLSDIDRAGAAVIPLAFTLAQGAIVASLGLALATWFKRPGRAMAVSASAYVVASVGWVFLLELGVIDVLIMWLGRTTNNVRLAQQSAALMWLDFSLFSLCPLGGQMAPERMLLDGGAADRAPFWVFEAVALLAMLAAAALLLGLTLRTFDRCLGRCGERPRRPPNSRKRTLRPSTSRPTSGVRGTPVGVEAETGVIS